MKYHSIAKYSFLTRNGLKLNSPSIISKKISSQLDQLIYQFTISKMLAGAETETPAQIKAQIIQ